MRFTGVEVLFKSFVAEPAVMPPTELFSEGWLLRLMLDRFAFLSLANNPLAVAPGCKWYSEALLPSKFLKRTQDDLKAESWTHADGVIGQFNIGADAKGDLTLSSNAEHFVVLEAKIFSKLSPGVKNAPGFNQAARIVACIAEVLKRANRPAECFKSLGFYILAPESQIKGGMFSEFLKKDSLLSVIKQRGEAFGGDLSEWFSVWLESVISKLDIREISWESLIDLLPNDEDTKLLKNFYDSCKKYNARFKKDDEQSLEP